MTHQYLTQKLGEDYHSFVYKILFYILVGNTIQVLLLCKSPKFYKNFLDKIFGIKISILKHEITIYFAMIIWIVFLFLSFFIIKFQLNDFKENKWSEIGSRPQSVANFHKNKWILEAELWMVVINFVESV